MPCPEPRIENLPRVRRALLRWHSVHGLQAPWRESRNPYHVLVAAIMAQQTQMSRVMPAYERFIAAFPTLESLATAPRAAVLRAWAGMGYNRRAVYLHEAARTVRRLGAWPRSADQLAQLHGVGPFAAAIIASFAFDQPAACVDTNVRRVLGRLAADEDVSGARPQRLANGALARRQPARWNQALMDYGATVCTPRPHCSDCVIARWCASRVHYEAPRMVADGRAGYNARKRASRPEPYTASARYYRGRIVDALRVGPVRLDALPKAFANRAHPPSAKRLRDLTQALVKDGLAVIEAGVVSLPRM